MIQRISSLMALVLFFGASSGLWAQTISVGGTVVDGDMPLPGVSVTVKGAYAGTATDLDGKFALTAESGATVVFSYIGYLRKELTVANTVADLKVVLQPDVAGLEEAVVIGYGNQQRSKISGAVTTVDIK
ncbi:MAG: carboxypeptidase-like regulatory domain-containing protein, partial [Bacteroidota bacterium]|nr:carboxypeptidase-like regulatory domain-containing protein [Bacteroidota bacterium]